jgi:hypothetical protein
MDAVGNEEREKRRRIFKMEIVRLGPGKAGFQPCTCAPNASVASHGYSSGESRVKGYRKPDLADYVIIW